MKTKETKETKNGKAKNPDMKLELMDWKQVEQHSEEAMRKQLVDLEVTRRVRELAKKNILELGGKTSEVERKEAKEKSTEYTTTG